MIDKPIIIELLGPSGSGKSTFVELALNKSRFFDNVEMAAWRGLISSKVVKLPFAQILCLIPVRFAYHFRLTKMVNLYRDQILRQKGGSYRKILAAAQNNINNLDLDIEEKFWLIDKFIGTVVNHILIEQSGGKKRIVLADEFFLQKVVRISASDTTVIDKLLDLIPKPSASVLFKVDLKIAVERIRSRNSNRNLNAQSMTNETLTKKLERSSESALIVAEKLKSDGVNSFVINDSSEVPDLIGHLLKNYA